MKNYDLAIQEFREFEGGHLGWWSKGHHDPIAFLFAVTEDMEERLEVTHDRVIHCYWRCVPVGAGEKGVLFCNAKQDQRGAFPVTVVED